MFFRFFIRSVCNPAGIDDVSAAFSGVLAHKEQAAVTASETPSRTERMGFICFCERRGSNLLVNPPLISHLSPLISHLSPLISHLSSLISHLSPLTSHLSPLISHLSSLTSHLSPLTTHYSPLTKKTTPSPHPSHPKVCTANPLWQGLSTPSHPFSRFSFEKIWNICDFSNSFRIFAPEKAAMKRAKAGPTV